MRMCMLKVLTPCSVVALVMGMLTVTSAVAAEDGSYWGALVAGYYDTKDPNGMDVARAAYATSYISKEDAIGKALLACRTDTVECSYFDGWNDGSKYVALGYNEADGSVSYDVGETPEEATAKCEARGMTCRPNPLGGYIAYEDDGTEKEDHGVQVEQTDWPE